MTELVKRVFLGGTCTAGADWRSSVMKELDKTSISYFNPVVAEWNDSARLREEYEKETCKVLLFYIDVNYLKGVFSIAEFIDLSNKTPHRVLIYVKYSDNPEHKHLNNSIKESVKVANSNGATVIEKEDELIFAIKEALDYSSNHTSEFLWSLQDGLSLHKDPYRKVLLVKDSFGNVVQTVKNIYETI